MVSSEHIGKLVQYWTPKIGSGWRVGTLLRIEGVTAVIHHSVLKREQKVHVNECKPVMGEIMSDTIFDHLFRVAQTKGVEKQQPGESDQDYLKKVLRAVHSVDVPVWNSLPLKAQEWFNEAATAVSSAHQVPLCPGFIGKDEVQKTVETVTPPKGLSASEALATQTSKTQASRPTISNPTKRKREVTGIMDALRKTVILHPEWTSRQLYDYLKLNGFPNAKIETISVDGGNIKRVIELAKQLGYWNEKGNQNVEVKTEVEEVSQQKAG